MSYHYPILLTGRVNVTTPANAVCGDLELDPMARHINPNGGAIAPGHPLGKSGARLFETAALELSASGKSRALCSMCVGDGQRISASILVA